MRQSGEYSSAITGLFLSATGTAVLHIPKNGVGVFDYRVTAVSFDMSDKPDPTAVVFELRSVEAAGCRIL